MKTYDQKTKNVFEKIEKYKVIQIKRRKKIRTILAVSAGLCVVTCIAVFAFQDKASTLDPGRSSESEILIQHSPIHATNERDTTDSTYREDNETTERIPGESFEPMQENNPLPNGSSSTGGTEPIQTEVTKQTEITIIETTEFTQSNPGESIDFFYIIIDGKPYYQIFDRGLLYSQGDYLGRAMNFDGFYKTSMSDGAVYRSAEDANVLLIYLDSGELHILMCYE